MDKDEKKSRKIIFSKEIDSAIDRYAVGFLFIAVGLFLLLEPNYFAVPVATYIIGAIIGLIGVIGTGIELSKSAKIKGIDDLAIGAALFLGWLIQYVYIHALWANIVFFIFLIAGIHGVLQGLFRATYSIVDNAKRRNTDNGESSKTAGIGKLISEIVLFLTQLCGLTVAIINVMKAIGLHGIR